MTPPITLLRLLMFKSGCCLPLSRLNWRRNWTSTIVACLTVVNIASTTGCSNQYSLHGRLTWTSCRGSPLHRAAVPKLRRLSCTTTEPALCSLSSCATSCSAATCLNGRLPRTRVTRQCFVDNAHPPHHFQRGTQCRSPKMTRANLESCRHSPSKYPL